ncbi:MAG: TonB-dependent receptor [Acidobacteriota bacterium]
MRFESASGCLHGDGSEGGLVCRWLLWLMVAGLAIVAFPVTLAAQATEGTILGTVVDPTGGAVVNARVVVKSILTGAERVSATSETGEYIVTNLPLGSYGVTVEAPGFKRAVHPPVDVTVKARVRVNVTLEVGEITENVFVSAAAPLIRTDSPEVGGVISRQTLQEIPIFGRNFLAISALVPGTTNGPPVSRQRDLSGASVTVAGASAEANNFIIDGISNNMEFSGAMGVVPAIDAIQEFAIQTSQYSAEFGRSGGGVINVAIKSGTNELHGFAYDYLRNDRLNARPFDFTGTNPRKQPLRRNQFGFGAGGPIVKNRAFLFGNYEGIRFPSSIITTVTVPTALEKRGDFTQSGFSVFDPLTVRPDPANPSRRIRDPFPGNVIPAARFDPIAVRLLSFYPDPNFKDPNPNVRNNYLVKETNDDSLDSFNLKGDLNLTSNDTMTARYSQQRGGRRRSSWMPEDRLGAESSLDATNSGLTYTHVFSPTLVNEARVGYNYLRFGNTMLNSQDILGEFKIPGLFHLPFASGFPTLNLRNYTGAAAVRPIATLGTPFVLVEHSWQMLDNISWQKGRHALKFGAEYGRVANNRFQGRPGDAILTFDGTYTTPVVGQGLETLRNGVPDALLGLARQFVSNYALDAVRIRSQRFSAFAQDDWRVTPKLSLNLGLRYDFYSPYHEEQDRLGNFDPRTGQRVIPETTRRIIESVLGIPGGNLPPTFRYGSLDEVVWKANYLNFAPRFGFAYSINDRLVLRGGYGIFYGVTVSNNANNAGTEGVPFFFDFGLASELDTPIVIRNGFPTGGVLGPLSARTFSAYYSPLDRHDPYSQKYSFNLQFALAKGAALEVGFTGQRALAFPTLVPGNTPPPGPGAVQDRRPYPNIGFFWQFVPIGDSNYNGLEASFKLKETYGLAIQSAFTFSKSLGYSQGTEGQSTDDRIRDPYNFRYDYGLLNYDFRKRWVSSWIYRIPTAPGLPAFARHILNNWQTSGLVILQGGFPFQVRVSGQVLNTGFDANRADVLRDPNLPGGQRTRERWFDTGAFAVPAPYKWGNQAKNMLRVPGLAQVDFALQKSVPITEGKRLTFRMEASNFFNRVQLGPPAATLGSPNFGVIRSLQAGPRNIQMALRFDF